MPNRFSDNHSVAPPVAAAGSAHGDSTQLTPGFTLYPVTAADDTKGVKLPVCQPGDRVSVVNLVANKILKVYPPTGGSINGASANAAAATLSGNGATFACVSVAPDGVSVWGLV